MEECKLPAFGYGIKPCNRRKRRNFGNIECEYEDVSGLYDSGDDIVKRVRKLVFRTIDEAERFYIAYDREIGFDIRTQKVQTTKPNKFVQSIKWVCNREGYRKERADYLFRERESRPETRHRCNDFLRVAYHRYSGCYRVANFESNHSHELATAETAHLLRCNRYLTSADKSTLTHMTEIGIRPSKAMNFIQSLVGGTGKLPFMRKDGYNFLQKQKMEKIRYGDVNMAFNMLDGMRLHDPGFVLKHTENADGALATMFWCDSQSKVEYEIFGDVLVLDSTYKTNTYRFPLVILSGANNHASNCIFGAGIVCSETIQSYRWLLRAFKDAMNDKLPSAVITDQDASICQAIQDEFPGTPHRLCCWHLCRNAKKRVRKANFACEFVKLAKRKCSVQQFEEHWAKLVRDYGVADNSWVTDIYEKRAMWSEAYFNGVFLVGMSTTSRAESVNALLKLYLNPSLSLTDFIQIFYQALKQMRNNFIEKQLDDEIRKPKARLESALFDLEEHAANLCTKRVFKKIRKSISFEQGIITETIDKLGEGNFLFSFREYNKDEEKRYSVKIDVENAIFQCDCMMLESVGVPCSHILSGFKSMGIMAFPAKSIHNRWLIETGKRIRILFAESFTMPEVQRTRLGLLYKEFVKLYQLLSQDDSQFTNSLNKLRKITKDIEDNRGEAGDDEKVECNHRVSSSVDANYGIRDPIKVKSKGAPPRQKQNCGLCGVPGHNRVTCPKNPANIERHEDVRPRTRAKKNTDTPSQDFVFDAGI
ncbi:hypothetical protein OROMI_027216 [Orobanche minor]